MKQYNAARTYQFRVQLTRDDHRRLADHCRLYNGAVLERRDAWRDGRSPSPASAVSSRWSARTIRYGLANTAVWPWPPSRVWIRLCKRSSAA